MERAQSIALIAHDNKKDELLKWAQHNREIISQYSLFATGTTGGVLQRALGLPVHRFQSGPLGGDLQVGAKLAAGEIDLLVFFWDPLEAQPHDPDIKALLRVAVLWNVPVACNIATADYIITSPLMGGDYERELPDHEAWRNRSLPNVP